MMRLCACWRVPVDIILPCGFAASDRQLKRAAMDYGPAADVVRHADFAAFAASLAADARLIALTSGGDQPVHAVSFMESDVLLMGRESAGLPDFAYERVAIRARIPMAEGFRSLNLAMAAAIALGEALRQTGGFPA